MGKTHAQKMMARQKRLMTLPKRERLMASAAIKKKEGRVLDSREKHAIKMSGEVGAMVRAWEVARSENTTPADRQTAMETIVKTVLPKFQELVKTPRVSRILQTVIKISTAAVREQLLTRCAQCFADLCNDGFAFHVIVALIRHADKESFRKIVLLTQSVMSSIVSHAFGMRVVQAVYGSKFCNATDRDMLIIGVFKDSVAVMKGWKGYPHIESILEQEPGHRKRLVGALFALIDKLTSGKEGFALPFVHRLAYVYLRNGHSDEAMELVHTLKPHVASFVDTMDGALLAATCFSVLPPKQRKEVLREIAAADASHIIGEKYGAPLMARICDLVYDGQVLSKFVTAPLIAHLPQVMASPYGHCVVLHLLTPDAERKRHALPPYFLDPGFNLYSRGNPHWKHHTWRDANMQDETVEICDREAERTHLMVLPAVVAALMTLMRKSVGSASASKKKKPTLDEEIAAQAPTDRVAQHFLSKAAKELLHLQENEPTYRAAFAFTDDDVAVLKACQPRKALRGDAEEHPATAAEDAEHQRPSKKARKDDGTASPVVKKAGIRPTSQPTPVLAATTTPSRRSASIVVAASPDVAPTPVPSAKATAAAAASSSRTTPAKGRDTAEAIKPSTTKKVPRKSA